MCATCGCSDDSRATLTDLRTGEIVPLPRQHENSSGHDHHHHDHAHPHSHPHPHEHGNTLVLEKEILARNHQLAERNRGWLAGRSTLALNLVSSPGAGKTTLLERTIRDLGQDVPLHVIEGDQQTLNDARRIQSAGAPVVQINTGTACHLDAAMIARALEQLNPPLNSLVMIENVGNLVCPALFDLGEQAKVVIMSVTEGEDKPIKYPHMFRASTIMVLNKIDLLPYVSFEVSRCLDYARQVNASLKIFQLSATRGDGLADWYAWLRTQRLPAPHSS